MSKLKLKNNEIITINFQGSHMYKDVIRAELSEAANVLNVFLSDDKNISAIEAAAKLLANSFKAGGKVLSCGNGGSHCDAMHFAEELTGRYRENRPVILLLLFLILVTCHV